MSDNRLQNVPLTVRQDDEDTKARQYDSPMLHPSHTAMVARTARAFGRRVRSPLEEIDLDPWRAGG